MTAPCPALRGCGRWRPQHCLPVATRCPCYSFPERTVSLNSCRTTAALTPFPRTLCPVSCPRVSEGTLQGGQPAGNGKDLGRPFDPDTARPRVRTVTAEHCPTCASGLALRWWPGRDRTRCLCLAGGCHLCAGRGHTAHTRATSGAPRRHPATRSGHKQRLSPAPSIPPVPEAGMALEVHLTRAAGPAFARPSGPACLVSCKGPAHSHRRAARPRTHAFLQLCIMRSCSPATALQAASSLVHFSWGVTSAREKGARSQRRRPLWLLGCPPSTEATLSQPVIGDRPPAEAPQPD